MPNKSSAALVVALTSIVPASAAHATSPAASLTPAIKPVIAGHASVTALIRDAGHAHARLVRRHRSLSRSVAKLEGHKVRVHRRDASWTDTRLRTSNRRLAHKAKKLRAAEASSSTSSYASNTTASPALQAIAQCESGGNPAAVGGGGAFRGKYQFTYSTWAAVGGSGDPAAAPEAEQDARAAQLYAQAGADQWPVCGR